MYSSLHNHFLFLTVAEYSGHVARTYFIKSCLSPCGSYLLSGSSDNFAYIWLTDSPGQPVAKLSGHFSEITAVDWCPIDNEKVGSALATSGLFICKDI